MPLSPTTKRGDIIKRHISSTPLKMTAATLRLQLRNFMHYLSPGRIVECQQQTWQTRTVHQLALADLGDCQNSLRNSVNLLEGNLF